VNFLILPKHFQQVRLKNLQATTAKPYGSNPTRSVKKGFRYRYANKRYEFVYCLSHLHVPPAAHSWRSWEAKLQSGWFQIQQVPEGIANFINSQYLHCLQNSNIQITSEIHQITEQRRNFTKVFQEVLRARQWTRRGQKGTYTRSMKSKNGPKTQSEPPLVREDGKKDVETRNREGAVRQKFNSSISELFGGFGRTFVQVRVLQTSNTN